MFHVSNIGCEGLIICSHVAYMPVFTFTKTIIRFQTSAGE